MGQFLSSTFFEDSQGAIWHERLYEGEGKGAGEATLVLQDQVMYGERGSLDCSRVRGGTASRGKGGPGRILGVHH